MKKIYFLIILLFTISVYAEDIYIAPKGEYAKINIQGSIDVIEQIVSNNLIMRDSAVKEVLTNPGNYIPPVLCELSSYYSLDKDAERTRFWFYACILRSLSDGNKTNDKSAQTATYDLARKFSPDIDDSKIDGDKLFDRVINWDEQTPRSYDSRWIMLHSVDMFGDKFNFAPKNKWEEIDKKSRKEFLSQFRKK